MSGILPNGKQQFIDSNGNPLASGKVYYYIPSTTTFKNTWQDSALSILNTNPIQLDANGQCIAYGEGSYRQQVYDVNNNLIWDQESDSPISISDVETLFSQSNGASLIDYIEPGSGAIQRNVQAKISEIPSLADFDNATDFNNYANNLTNPVNHAIKLKTSVRTLTSKLLESVSVLDFGAIADGNVSTGAGTDNTTAFQNAINALGTGGCLYIPEGVYNLHSQVTVPDNFQIIGSGIYSTILTCPNAFNSDGLIKFNGTGGAPSSIQNLSISAQLNGAGSSSIGLNLAANGSFGFNLWIGAFKTGVQLGSSSVFFYDSVCDVGVSGGTGINITSGATIVSNVQVYDNYVGVAISAPFSDGPITLDNIQAIQCSYCGFDITSSSNVQLSNCSVGSAVPAFSYAGILIVNSTNINISNFIGRLAAAQSSGNGGIYSANSSTINISNSQISKFYNGILISGGTEITINGNTCSNNYNAGIYAGGCDRTIISNNNCNTDGGGTADAGIYSANTVGYGIHNIIGNVCTQNGGGVQNYGIYATLTNNAGAEGFTNLVGNACKYNNTANISTNGYTSNISSTGNIN